MKNYKENINFINKVCNSNYEFIYEVSEVNWDYISIHQKLSEEFIKENFDKVNWDYISIHQKLSEEFIKENFDKVNWDFISQYQKLSEEFIKENSDKVNWDFISQYQKLSEEFIKENSDKVNWDFISQYQKLNEKFIEENNLSKSQNNWLYASKEDKLKYIKENTNYEIQGNNLIAFKAIRSNNYSVFNFQYKYEIGGTYYSHCDCDLDNEYSFGLSAWTKKEALEYYNRGKLLKVSIPIEKIGTIVHNNKKIRTFELTVIEEIK